jgi:O-antigen ligase
VSVVLPAPSVERAPLVRRAAPPRRRAAVTALSVWAFVIVARAGDLVPTMQVALLAAIVTGALALGLPSRPAVAIFRMPEVRAVLALLGLGIAFVPFSAWPGGSVAFIVTWTKSVVFFLAILFCVRSLADAGRLVTALVVAVLALGLAALATRGAGRVDWQSYDPNDLAFVMVCGFPWAVSLAVRGAGARRVLGAVAATLAAVTVVLTSSRGGFLAFVIIGAILLVRLRRRSVAAVGLAAGVALIVLLVASPAFWNRMGTILDSEDDAAGRARDEYDAGGLGAARIEIWRDGLALMASHPVTGVGAGAFEVAYRAATGIWKTGHSAYVQIGAELGPTGLALFLFLLWRTRANARAALRTMRASSPSPPFLWLAEGLELSLYGYAIGSAALSQAYSPVLHVLIALGVLLRRLAR